MFRIDEMSPLAGSRTRFQAKGSGFHVAIANIDRIRPTRDPKVCEVVLVGGMSYFAAGALPDLIGRLRSHAMAPA
ncbi:MAG: hypothetical protein F9K44_01765 [Hyphomicrobiaceae bacterium]|nr:MAG: hypothetical protein F9K44_01765 [Hyphomicrobiaceae bacterium]